MDINTVMVILAVSMQYVSCQKCPAYWTTYGSSNKCYRPMYLHLLSWQDARDMCRLHGGDLLKIDSVQERTWVFNQIAYLKNHSKIPSTKWWVGLNNREYLTVWEWADGSSVAPNVINWHPGEPNNHGGNERCGEINNNEFNDQECTDVNRYICSRYRSVPQKCDTDNRWQPVNGQCFKVISAKTTWYNAKQSCERSGGSMVTIKTEEDETVVHDFAMNLKQELWIGLFSVQQPGNQVQWQWTDHTLLLTNYWHGNPHVDRSHLNSSCVVMSSNVAALQAWTVQPCSQRRAYVCRKPEGVCFPGWLGHSSYCYQFNVQYRMSFDGATTYCKNQGAELLRYRSDTGTQFINSYLREMRDSGVSAFWIGASDNNSDAGPYKWRNGQSVTYKNWAAGATPANTKGKQDCVYVSTNDARGRWRTTNNCRSQWAFVCMTPMGASVTPATVTPSLHYGCPTNWRQYSGMCYRIYDDASDWVTSRTKCQQTPGADLAAIRSKPVLDFVNHNAAPGILYWIGLNDRAQEGVYVWNDERYPTTYTSWQPKQPNNYGETQNCVAQINGQWGDFPCSQKKRYICSKSANSVGIMPAPTQVTDWTVKCGPGWESNPLTTKCYMFVDQPLVWINAYDMCKSNNGDLVDIETLEEQNYLAGRLKSMNSIGVWIGLNDRSTERGWRWSSHRPFAFLNWAAGQPSSSGQGTDCVVMFTNTGEWDDVNCIQRNGYICEKSGNVPTTKPPATTTKKIPAGMVLGCRNGWKPYGTNCYLFRKMRSGINWMDARTMCGRYSAQLASIQSQNEQDFITANLWKNPKNVWDGVWIGLNDRQRESRFQWSDNSVVQFTQWNVGEPNSWRNHDEDCVFVYLNNSNWNDERCEAKIGGYVCKASKIPMSSTQGPFQIGCPKYSLGYNALCYRIVTGVPKTWSDANDYCNRTFHGTLATVNDRFVQGFISSQLLYRTGQYWLGLSDTAKPGTYVWASGDQVIYTDWDKTHIEASTNTCVAMNADQPIGLWRDAVCTLKQNFICQFPRTSGFSTEPKTPTPYPNVPCPTGWTAQRDKCLKAFLGKTNLMTWMDARTFCQSLGGDLPSIHGATNDSVLSTFVTQDTSLWIGLNDRDTEAGYKWSDGSAVDYTNWLDGEPNNYKGNEDCVGYWTALKGWNDNSCYETMNFVCAIPRGSTLPATTVIPPPSRSAQCGSDPNWYFFQQNCYMLPPTTGDKSSLDWYDANDYCNGINAHLASIHSVDEQFFIYGLIKQTSIERYWIGLNELGLNGYSWTDKTPVDYQEWYKGEPNNYFGAERCVEMKLENGRWNDDNCGLQRAYVCKKPVSGQVIIPTAAPYPSGGCANGFTRVPGGRNKCFYLNSYKLNYTAARDYCQQFGKGYDIASINNLFEQDFAMSMIKGHSDSQIYIGLNDRVFEKNFAWSDNSPVSFTHWGPREPTSNHPKAKANQDCVSIRNWKNREGEWTDMPCTVLHSSLCQAKQDPNLPISPPSGGCHSGYMPWDQGCYKISTDVKSWSDAKTACQNDGGALTSINDVYESGFVYTLASSNGAYWIGLSDETIPGLYGWVDGWPVRYTNWGLKQPSYKDGKCVKVGPNTDRWNDTNCDEQLHYVCKITSAKPPTTNPTPPGNCSDPTWIPNGAYCYMAQVNARNTWPEANFQCQKSGMELTSVHSKQEMDFIFTLVGQSVVKDPKYKPNIWLGLSKGSQGSYTWSDNSAVNFLYWNPGEPSQLGIHNEIEECIEFNRQAEKWNDISCFSQRGYVCKAIKGVSSLQLYLSQQSGSGQGSGNSPGLSPAAIAGIVIGCVVVILAIILVVIVKNCKGGVKIPKLNGNAGFDNKLYTIQNSGNRLESDA